LLKYFTGYKNMKSKILFSIVFLLLIVGLYSPASYSQTFNMWIANDAQVGNAWSFDVYMQRTGTTPLVVYAIQIGYTYTTASANGGVLTGAWTNVDPTLSAGGETPKAVSCATIPYIKCGWNVSPNGSGSGVTITAYPDSMRIGTLTVTNSKAWAGVPGITWYFGGAPGLPTKIQATNGSLAYDATAGGTIGYKVSAALPVELSSFSSNAKGRIVVLNWETKTEINSNRYDIEKSLVSTTSWSTIASVKASGTSNSPKKYSYSDTKLQSGKYQYRLKMVDNDGSFTYSSVEAAEVAIPKDFALSQNYPNPFNPSTKIDYQVPVDAKVIMEVYNIAGQKVMELVNQQMSAGYYTVDFGASKLSSGVYIYRLAASDIATGNNFSSIKKMMLLK
jgi:hypothetical protein